MANTTNTSAQSDLIIPLEAKKKRTAIIASPDKQSGWVNFFGFTRPRIGLNLSYEFIEEQRRYPGNDTSKNTSHDISEEIDFAVKGHLLHPAFCKYNVELKPEWNQLKEKHDSGETVEKDVSLENYMLSTTFLPYKKYTLELYSNRHNSKIKSAYASQSNTESENYGANFIFVNSFLPLTCDYNHLESVQTGFYRYEDESENYNANIKFTRKNFFVNLKSRTSDRIRSTRESTTRLKSRENIFYNKFDFLGNRKILLNSFITQRTTESDLHETESLEFDHYLEWRHRKNLKSTYRLKNRKNESNGIERESKSLSAGVNHLLYENLTTDITVRAQQDDYFEDEEKIYGGNLEFDYNRDIPWGTLSISMAHDYEEIKRNIPEQNIRVMDEGLVLRTVDFTVLNHQYVDEDSIIVTDNTGTIIYTKKIDYNISETDSFVRITRTNFGAITNGDTVLVSYEYLSDPAYDSSILGQTYGFSTFLWSRLLLRLRHEKAEEKLLSGIPPDTLLDRTANMAEVEYLWKWTDTSFLYSDIKQDSGMSTTTWRAEEELSFRPAKTMMLRLLGQYGERKFKETNETEKFQSFQTNFDWLPARWCKYDFEVYMKRNKGDLEETIDTKLTSEIHLRYRIWKSKIGYEYLKEDDKIFDQSRTYHKIYFEIIRALW